MNKKGVALHLCSLLSASYPVLEYIGDSNGQEIEAVGRSISTQKNCACTLTTHLEDSRDLGASFFSGWLIRRVLFSRQRMHWAGICIAEIYIEPTYESSSRSR